MHPEARVPVKVWDVPVRAVHWLLVPLLAVQVVTGKLGGAWMTWHVYSGYAAMVVVFFRLAWGFVGSTHARFTSFLKGPAAGLRFARRLFSREAVSAYTASASRAIVVLAGQWTPTCASSWWGSAPASAPSTTR